MKYLLIMLTLVCSLQAQTETKQFIHDGVDRSYIVFKPQNFASGLPLVLNLHGYDQSATGQMNHSKMNVVADTAGFIVVYPFAINEKWNSGIADNPARPTPEVDDVGFLAALIDTIVQDYQADSARVFSTGLSNGGYMSFRLTSERSNKLTKMASVTGTLTNTIANACSTYTPIPIFMLFGTADPLVTYDGDAYRYSAEETLNFWLDKNSCSTHADTVVLPDLDPNDRCTIQIITFSDCSSGQEVIFCKVLNGGHLWPGSGVGFTATYGPVNEDISGSELIWSFFNDNLSKYTGDPVQISEYITSPLVFRLKPNYPNPINPTTNISYDIPENAMVILSVYDMQGREITTLKNQDQPAGHYEVQWNGVDGSGNSVSTGVYFARLQAGDYSKTIKMVYLK